MKRAIYFTLLWILIFLTSITIAVAKGSADKITISGPGLMKPIEITDPQRLQLFSPWDNNYVDVQKGALAVAPKADQIYEILLYVKDDHNQPQVRYAFQYAPGQPGYIYVPGKGDPWYDTNIGTISRGSTIEGHWFYASNEWGDLMQHILGDKRITVTNSPPQSEFEVLSSFSEWLAFGVVIVFAGVLLCFFRRGYRRIA